MPTKLQQYAEIQALVQKEAREIALQVYKEQATKYGVAKVPLHKHNGSDSPTIGAASITNFLPLPSTDGGVASLGVLNGQIIDNPVDGSGITETGKGSPPTIYVMPLSTIYGFGVGTHSAFEGGDAPAGSMVIFSNGSTAQLYIRVDTGLGVGAWRGVNLPITV